MPNVAARSKSWAWVAAVVAASTIAGVAHAAGGGGGSAGNNGTSSNTPPKTSKRAKVPSHFEIKPSERLGVLHAFSPDFSLEAFVRGQQNVLDNPWSLRTTFLSGGLQSAYKFNATTWFVTLEARQVFSKFYQHTQRMVYLPRTALQQSIGLGSSGLSLVPRLEVGYEMSDDTAQNRWKVKLDTPLSYKLSSVITLFPLMPQLAFQSFTDRPSRRQDWTMTMATGARWFFTPTSYLEMDFGYKNRWSNVPSAEYSRWMLLPQLYLRFAF